MKLFNHFIDFIIHLLINNSFVPYMMHEFCTRCKRKLKNTWKKESFHSKLEGGGSLEGFHIVVCLGGRVGMIYSSHDVWLFHAMITLQCRKLEPMCLRFRYHMHRQLHFVCFVCKVDNKIYFFNYIHFLFFFYKYI
jgi:hypothetical protein